MGKLNLILVFVIFYTFSAYSQEKSPFISFEDYDKLVDEVKIHRMARLVDLDEFISMAKESGVIVLDTRSDSMYNSKHIKGAIHLNFSDFTQSRLAEVIPSSSTKILIYCNNNFKDDELNFPTKESKPIERIKGGGEDIADEKRITLALNIPTYINLYGYGYRNVYELSELVSVSNPAVEFEGTSVNNETRTR
jgi:hypothetical protein